MPAEPPQRFFGLDCTGPDKGSERFFASAAWPDAAAGRFAEVGPQVESFRFGGKPTVVRQRAVHSPYYSRRDVVGGID